MSDYVGEYKTPKNLRKELEKIFRNGTGEVERRAYDTDEASMMQDVESVLKGGRPSFNIVEHSKQANRAELEKAGIKCLW